MREIRLALLEADVSYKVVKDFVKKTTERCVGSDVLESLTPAQMIVKIVNEELTNSDGQRKPQSLTIASKPPTVVMMAGLQGAGKTTHTAQSWPGSCTKSRVNARCSSACDIYRPGCHSSSCRSSAKSMGLPVFTNGGSTEPHRASPRLHVAHAAESTATTWSFWIPPVVCISTRQLMEELSAHQRRTVQPTEILLVARRHDRPGRGQRRRKPLTHSWISPV